MESKDNIALLCKECGDARRKAWQVKNKNLKLEVGDVVKIAVVDGEEIEHMWFEVVGLDGCGCSGCRGEIIGKCNNEAFVVKNCKFGELRNFKFKDIEDRIAKDK